MSPEAPLNPDDALVQRFRREILAPLALMMGAVAEELRKRPIKQFGQVIYAMVGEALEGLAALSPGGNIENLTPYARTKIGFYLVVDLNAALAADHPYLVGLVSLEEEDEHHFVAMYRADVLDPEQMTDRKIFLRVKLKNKAEFESGSFGERNDKTKGQDDLEDLNPA